MLGDQRFLRTIKLRNLLSFGPGTPELELNSLNVLIGPNGSGKSNLIEAVSLLRAAPASLFDPIRTGGGITEWLCKGASSTPIAEIDATLCYLTDKPLLRHLVTFTLVGQRAELVEEAVEDLSEFSLLDPLSFHYRYEAGRPSLRGMTGRYLVGADAQPDLSIISRRKDPQQYPEITYLGEQYSRIRLFREWNLGRNAPSRRPQPADLPSDFLAEDASNLALVLNDLEHRGNLRSLIVEHLREADGSIVDFSTRVLGGTIQLFLHYDGLNNPIPASRLSDGTVRYLCLLAVLCHPDPPPLVCIEEPELGLHPDMLSKLAELLIEASHRMQLIVTTHSDTLVDGLTSVPEAVLVCEKHNGATQITRRSHNELADWLKDYGLGQLWRRGDIGGNRW